MRDTSIRFDLVWKFFISFGDDLIRSVVGNTKKFLLISIPKKRNLVSTIKQKFIIHSIVDEAIPAKSNSLIFSSTYLLAVFRLNFLINFRRNSSYIFDYFKKVYRHEYLILCLITILIYLKNITKYVMLL